jgi:hypothetical protein
MFESSGVYLAGTRDNTPCMLSNIDKVTQSVTVTFDDGDTHPNIPASRVKPVSPGIDEYAMPFAGKWKGRLVRITGQDRDTKLYDGRLVSMKGGMTMDLLVSFHGHELAKIEYP